MIVLGIDPGSNRMGWARVDVTEDLLLGGRVERFHGDLLERLDQIREALPGLMQGVDAVAFEKMFSIGNFGDRALHGVAVAIQCAARAAGVPCHEIPCATARRLVIGRGNADKDDVERSLLARWGLPAGAFESQDVSDAACLALAVPAWPEHQARVRAEKAEQKRRRAARAGRPSRPARSTGKAAGR